MRKIPLIYVVSIFVAPFRSTPDKNWGLPVSHMKGMDRRYIFVQINTAEGGVVVVIPYQGEEEGFSFFPFLESSQTWEQCGNIFGVLVGGIDLHRESTCS